MKAEADKRNASLTEAEKLAMTIANCDRFVASYDQVVANLKPQIDSLPANHFWKGPYMWVNPNNLAALSENGVKSDKFKCRGFNLELSTPFELVKLIRTLEEIVAKEKALDPVATFPKNDPTHFVEVRDIAQMQEKKLSQVSFDGLVTPRNVDVWETLLRHKVRYDRDESSFEDAIKWHMGRAKSSLDGIALIQASALLAFQETLGGQWAFLQPWRWAETDYSELPFMIGYGMVLGQNPNTDKMANLIQLQLETRQMALQTGGLSELYIKADTLMMTLALQYGALIRRNWME